MAYRRIRELEQACRTALFLAAGLSGLLVDTAAAEDAQVTAPSISVIGRAEIAAEPDLVRVGFAVETTAPTAARAAEDNRSRAERVIAALRTFTQEHGRLATTGFRITPIYESSTEGGRRSEKPILAGYRAHNEITVELRDLAGTGELIDAAVAAGADVVTDVHFDLADRSATLRRAVAAAGRDATAQAEAVATALGVRLGPIRSASTTPEPFRLPESPFAGRAVVAAAQTPVEPGQVTVAASVQVTYQIAE